MSEFFLSVLNMSISASWIVLAVLLLRFLLKKAPKWITVLLWAVVALRLICPFTIESKVSLIPSAQTISPNIMMDTVPQVYTGIPAVNNSINPIIEQNFAPNPGGSINPLQVLIPVAAVIWGLGILALITYGSISYFRVKKKVSAAVLLRVNIYQSEAVASPFVLGIIRPKIYLPFSLTVSEMLHVIAHEEAHIRRKDHWWKPIGFTILTLHWFNPLMWLAYVLLCRDIEMACDERVVKSLSPEERADYSQALLNCSVGRRMIASCPLAFGEVGVKDRVKSVLSYKKPAFWILAVGIVASIVLAVCFLTNPKPGELGTLENLEFISLTGRVENTACVWVSDGVSYERVGAISEDLLRDLASVKTSKEEISLSRSEDRDKSHTIVLQTEKQAEPSPNSYLEGLYIHFNSDFTAVWINNSVKPTLTYKVIDPQRAKEIYSLIANFNIVGSIAVSPAYMDSIEPLKEKYEQGLDSPFAPEWHDKPEDGYFDSGPLKTIHGNFRTYYQNTDGTWQYNGYIYKHRLVITGRMPNAVADTTYVYLSNLEEISFERAMWASGLSSSLELYFSPEEAVLVEIFTGEPDEATSSKDPSSSFGTESSGPPHIEIPIPIIEQMND